MEGVSYYHIPGAEWALEPTGLRPEKPKGGPPFVSGRSCTRQQGTSRCGFPVRSRSQHCGLVDERLHPKKLKFPWMRNIVLAQVATGTTCSCGGVQFRETGASDHHRVPSRHHPGMTRTALHQAALVDWAREASADRR